MPNELSPEQAPAAKVGAAQAVDPASFAARRAALVDDGTLRGSEFGAAYSVLVDEWIRSILGDEPGVAVIGGGALGRRELAPASDLDLVLIHNGRRDFGQVADRLWYPIWDAGIALDHSVRTQKEAVAVAGDDLKVVLSLLDGRPVAGDLELGARVLEAVRDRWIGGARKRFAALESITRERHAKEGDVAHLLEPDLKQGKGGLRDLRVLHGLALVAPITDPGDLTEVADRLLAVRVELHRVAHRATDRLLLQYQDEVAERLELQDADALMAEVAAAGRAIAWAVDDSWARARSWRAGPKGRGGGGDRDVGRGLVLRDGELDVRADADLEDDTLILRAAEAAARHVVRFRRGALERLAASAPGPGDPWSTEAHQAFIGLLGAGEPLVPVVEALEHYDLMTRLIPEWTPLRSRPQRNSFHRFTVDRHLIEAVVQASRLTRVVGRPDLLLVGALLHDIGKGYPGDHTIAGVELVGEIAPRLGFAPEGVDVLVTLVREHLLLASVATSRDLSDPVTIDGVARAVGSRPVLELLAALTKADSLATGEAAWSSWKEELIDDLVRRVDAVLRGQPSSARADESDASRRELVTRAAGEVLVDADETRVAVVAPDRPGLLAAIVGLLALRGQSVQSAVATTDHNGIAVDTFTIRSEFDRPPAWDGFRDELTAVLDGSLDLAARVEERAHRYRPARSLAARPPDPVALVHLGAASGATVVEVRSPDDVGVLFRIARTFTDLGLDIHQARAVTLGQEVVDTFYVRDGRGAPVDDRASEITGAIVAMLLRPR